MYVCPYCENPINQATEICPYCSSDLTQSAGGEAEEGAQKRSLVKVLLFSVVLVLGVWGVVWYVLPHQASDPAKEAETTAANSLREVASALAAYADSAGGYPQSLEQLADTVRPAAQQAQREGYQIVYTPGALAADGTIRGYALVARPGNYGYRDFYLDQTGVLRATRENRPATAQDPPF